MKKEYATPELSVMLFDNEDIITASSTGSLADLGIGNDDGSGSYFFEQLFGA